MLTDIFPQKSTGKLTEAQGIRLTELEVCGLDYLSRKWNVSRSFLIRAALNQFLENCFVKIEKPAFLESEIEKPTA